MKKNWVLSYVFLTLFALLVTGCQGTPTAAATETLTPLPLSMSEPSTAVPGPTRAPLPTLALTPQPTWVTGFAQPILSAIAARPPDWQDDFSDPYSGWDRGWCPGEMEYVEGELVITNCGFYRPNIDWQDIVVEYDVRFVDWTAPNAYWLFEFREIGRSHDMFLYPNGDLFFSFDNRTNRDDVSISTAGHAGHQTQHVLMIAQGDRFAFYLNGQPVYYTENDALDYGRCNFSTQVGSTQDPAAYLTAAIDNFKIWDISDVTLP